LHRAGVVVEEDLAFGRKMLRAGQAGHGIVDVPGGTEAEQFLEPGLRELRQAIDDILTIERSTHLLL
jgi:hypothetical protein